MPKLFELTGKIPERWNEERDFLNFISPTSFKRTSQLKINLTQNWKQSRQVQRRLMLVRLLFFLIDALVNLIKLFLKELISYQPSHNEMHKRFDEKLISNRHKLLIWKPNLSLSLTLTHLHMNFSRNFCQIAP